MKKSKLPIVTALILTLTFSPSYNFRAHADTMLDGSDMMNLADDLYKRYYSETDHFDKSIMSCSTDRLEDMFSDIKEKLSGICSSQQIQKYTEKMKSAYKFSDYQSVNVKSDILLKSRILKYDEKSAVIRQFREITDQDTEWVEKDQTYRVVKYIFLENENGWKLKDLLDTRQFIQKPNDMVIDSQYQDVTGDSISDSLYLVINKNTTEDSYVSSVRVVVNGISFSLNSNFFAGYNPSLSLQDLDGDKVADVFISIETARSNGSSIHYGFTLKDNIFKQILNESPGSNEMLP